MKTLDVVLLCLAGGTVFYLSYLFLLQLSSPSHALLLWEPEPAILVSEIAICFVVGIWCILTAIAELKEKR